MDRHTAREKSMICIYQNLLCDKDVDEAILDVFADKEDDFAFDIIKTSINNKDRYMGYINQVMNDYTFDRLGYIERAILLLACSEFDKQTAFSSVIIDEAILLAKKYCDESAYKLINSVLDKL